MLEPLILDLVEWVAREPRRHADVMEAWRTSCPRLPVWEAAMDRGYLQRRRIAPGTYRVVVTEAGLIFLRENGRTGSAFLPP